MTSKVYVIHDTGNFDLVPAMQHGSLVSVVTQNVSILDNSTNLSKIRRKLKDFDEYNDYILCIGSPILIFLAGQVLGELGIEKINFLVWDKKYKTYIKITQWIGGNQ